MVLWETLLVAGYHSLLKTFLSHIAPNHSSIPLVSLVSLPFFIQLMLLSFSHSSPLPTFQNPWQQLPGAACAPRYFLSRGKTFASTKVSSKSQFSIGEITIPLLVVLFIVIFLCNVATWKLVVTFSSLTVWDVTEDTNEALLRTNHSWDVLCTYRHAHWLNLFSICCFHGAKNLPLQPLLGP